MLDAFGGCAVLASSVRATPGVDVPDDTIDGFPEFAFTIDTIKDPAVTTQLRALAKAIVASHATSNRIIGFEAHGHADVTLRLPPGPERDRAELEVSRDRAENARDLLLQLIEQEGGGAIIAGIRANASAQGFGAQFTKFNPARTEAERRKNRRVEIFLKTFQQPPRPVDKGIQKLTLWLNAFIASDVKNGDGSQMSFTMARGPHRGETAIPGPFNGKVPGFDDCYLTDQRSFDGFNRIASSRIHAEVIIDFSGDAPVMTPVPPLGATVDTVRLRVSTGEVLNTGRGIARGGFSKGPGFAAGSRQVEVRFNVAGSNPIAKMPRVVFIPPPLTLPIPLKPSSSDPQSLADPDIDMIGSFVIDAQTRKLKFRAVVDGFPFYEGYVVADGGSAVTIFRLSPRPGENPASGLPGLPNRAIEVDLNL
jgi:hypothetical protein